MADVLDPPPEPTAADKLLEVAHSVASELPVAGTVVEMLRQLFGTPYQRRQEAWLRALYDLVLELQGRGYDVGELVDRPEFVTAVHDASRIAIGEHLEEKLEMLKAVLFHAATSPADPLADVWTLRYVRWVDELEPQHVQVLRFAADPRGWLTAAGRNTPEFMGTPRRTVLDLAGLPFADDQLDLVLEDLRDRRLADLGAGMVSKNAVYSPWITDRGTRFLEWLTIV